MSAFLVLIYSTQVERKEVPYLAINRNQHVLLACLNSGLSELNLYASKFLKNGKQNPTYL
jgi:hypothetical protein